MASPARADVVWGLVAREVHKGSSGDGPGTSDLPADRKAGRRRDGAGCGGSRYGYQVKGEMVGTDSIQV